MGNIILTENDINKMVFKCVNNIIIEGIKTDHPSSLVSLYEFKFYDLLYMPGGLREMCQKIYNENKGNYNFLNSYKKTKIGSDDAHSYDYDKMLRIANNLAIDKSRIFEIVAEWVFEPKNGESNYKITRFAVKSVYDKKTEASIIFSAKSPLIITAWIDDLDGNHEMVNPKRYITSKQDRQKRVQSILDSLNNLKQLNKNETLPGNNN